MKKLFFWFTIASAAGAAYLMFKRGVPLGEIAQSTAANPVGTLAQELKSVI